METALSLTDSLYDTMYSDMMIELESLSKLSGISNLKYYQQCAELCKKIIQEVKQHLVAHPFNNEQEEIVFFKHIKPKFLSQYIYYSELHNITLRRPTGNKSTQEAFLNTEYYRLKFTFETNVELYHYYRNEESYLDEQFYLRNNKVINKSLNYVYVENDPLFSTGYDFMISRFIAYEMLSGYITQAVDELQHPEINLIPNKNKLNLTWTGTRVALAELIYAFHASGCFNDGKTDVKELAEFICNSFNKKVDHIYKVFEEIRIRKRSRTQFLDNLKEDLNKRMDKDDENAF